MIVWSQSKKAQGKDEVLRLLQTHRIEKVLVVDEAGMLKGMMTVKDIQKAQDYPNACKDESGSLLVGAAVVPARKHQIVLRLWSMPVLMSSLLIRRTAIPVV